jgi:hypothetical protein
MTLDLTDDEKLALAAEPKRNRRGPLSTLPSGSDAQGDFG